MSISNRRAASKDLFTPTAKAADRLTFQGYKAINKRSLVRGNIPGSLTGRGLKRATYYLHPVQLFGLSAYAFDNDLDKSEIVRLALDNYLGEEYLKKGLDKYNKTHIT